MHKFIMTTCLLGALVGAPAVAIAEEELRIEHYEAQNIETKEEAQEVLARFNAEIDEILTSETLSMEQMERIHEISYTLEKALPMLDQDDRKEAAEALEGVHLSSESHEEAKLRENYDEYIQHLNMLTQ